MQSLNENKCTMTSGARKKKPLLSFTIEEKTKNVKAISIELLSSLAIRLL
jgi:hypothetical protein